jgi:hypothetical protein
MMVKLKQYVCPIQCASSFLSIDFSTRRRSKLLNGFKGHIRYFCAELVPVWGLRWNLFSKRLLPQEVSWEMIYRFFLWKWLESGTLQFVNAHVLYRSDMPMPCKTFPSSQCTSSVCRSFLILSISKTANRYRMLFGQSATREPGKKGRLMWAIRYTKAEATEVLASGPFRRSDRHPLQSRHLNQ